MKVRVLSLLCLGLVLPLVLLVDLRPLLAEKGDIEWEEYDLDPNTVIAIRAEDWNGYTSITLYTGKGVVVLDWSTGVLDVSGDRQAYTEAAKTFLTSVCSGAAYEIVAHDPEKIRRLVKGGHFCEAVGHTWPPTEAPPGYVVVGRTCMVCGKIETRELTEWK